MKKLLLLISFLTLIGFCLPTSIFANSGGESSKVLVVYSEKNPVEENHKRLDLLLSHFTTDIEYVRDVDFSSEDTEEITHLFYHGGKQQKLPDALVKAIQTYEGKIVAFGHNTEQFGSRYNFATPMGLENFNELYLTAKPEEKIETEIHNVFNIKADKTAEVLAWAKAGHIEYPLITKKNKVYYVGSKLLISPFSLLLGEVLHEVFETAHTNDNPGYMRLEDVHPLVDPVKLKEVADVLIDKNIPFMVAVIPVYVNPETGANVHMSDHPEVLDVLKYMQKNGGSVVLHGYTHQYRSTETGEGFEFWDVENNTPIYKEADDNQPIKNPHDFKTDLEYESYLATLEEFERQYITDKVNKGMSEMLGFGITPLAFEAPHYTMSQNGYQTIAKHFSHYVGQVQLSDKDWEIMDGAPYITQPSFLGGMTLLPETLGYVQPENPDAIEEIIDTAEEQLIVRDGILSVFYHPYLGVEGFKKLVNRLEKFPIDWIDLKEENTTVNTSDVSIKSSGEKVSVNQTRIASITTSKISFTYFIRNIIDKITWAMVGTGTLAVIVFFSYTIVSYRRLAKEERRDEVG
ncbi:DUF2334 domain-containing protein [Halobacillus litoralis]|uniref:DUF2334 domain-containing protein n=1 Tax=Halobacillus litoralis TaxID=45668 RepID=A0A410MFY2_9BACI|nr:polysaccharide deacetylase family protein [Halobacillus litoralis]QAS53613.1 hypothetical protein HLI_16090 [Halobacillus litoralis]